MSDIHKAKDALLRALEQLDQGQEILEGEPDRVDLVVLYSMGRDHGDGGWHEIGGYLTTPGPKWVHASLCRRAADAQDDDAREIDEEPEE